MLTENQIRKLSLVGRQKLILDLRMQLKDYHEKHVARQQLERQIDFILRGADWKEPVMSVKVRNIAEHDITINGRPVKAGAEAMCYPWEARALCVYLDILEGEDEIEKLFPS